MEKKARKRQRRVYSAGVGTRAGRKYRRKVRGGNPETKAECAS